MRKYCAAGIGRPFANPTVSGLLARRPTNDFSCNVLFLRQRTAAGGLSNQSRVVCVKFSKLVMVRVRWLFRSLEQHPFVRSETTIPSSRPAYRQSAARSGSQGCRRERGGTGGAGAKRP